MKSAASRNVTRHRPLDNAIGSSNLRLQPDERSDISLAQGYPTRGGRAGQGLRQIRSYLVKCATMASQAFSASANVLKGDPPTRTAVLLKLMGRQEATKPGCPWSPGPLRLSLLMTNEKPLSFALHISSSSVAGAMRPKCRAIPPIQTTLKRLQPVGSWNRQPSKGFLPARVRPTSGAPEVTMQCLPGSAFPDQLRQATPSPPLATASAPCRLLLYILFGKCVRFLHDVSGPVVVGRPS
jgi:hypothetical protein